MGYAQWRILHVCRVFVAHGPPGHGDPLCPVTLCTHGVGKKKNYGHFLGSQVGVQPRSFGAFFFIRRVAAVAAAAFTDASSLDPAGTAHSFTNGAWWSDITAIYKLCCVGERLRSRGRCWRMHRLESGV